MSEVKELSLQIRVVGPLQQSEVRELSLWRPVTLEDCYSKYVVGAFSVRGEGLVTPNTGWRPSPTI